MLTYCDPQSLRHFNASIAFRLAGVQGLLQRIEHEVSAPRTTHPLADDAHIDDEGYVQPTLPGRYLSEVSDLQLIGPLGMELPVNPVQRVWRLCIVNRDAHHLSTHYTA